nr:reverse transcriptase domain-containing protein [Tanacetum cinerariifolium]GFA65723.1 reverse transcriptase domain-containing protein [Tanacetum cinerariifolium]
EATRKDHFPLPFMDQMLERLAGNEYYLFLDGFSGYFQIPIDPQDQEKTTFTCPYGTFAYRRMPFGLCNAPGTFQRCMMAIFHDMIEETMKVFMDDFSVFRDSFSSCLSHLDKMLKRCEDINLVLYWEKCHFMVKKGIVLGHKISKYGIEVDRAKVNVIAKLPPPTTVKGVRSFLGHAGFYRRFIQDFSKIARPITHLLEKETPFIFSTECREAFETLKKMLTEASILVPPIGTCPSKLYGVYTAKKPSISSWLATMDPPGDIMVPTTSLKKYLIQISIGLRFIEMPMTWSHGVTLVNVKARSRNVMRCLKVQYKFARFLIYEASTLWARSHLLEGTSTFSWPLTTCQHGLKQKRSPPMMPELPVGENHASWSDKLDDALWAFRTAFQTSIGCTPYKLMYGKACHLPIELDHKAYWALKHCNFDLKSAGDHQKVQMNELNELRNQAYENSLIYKEKTKKIHDSKIKNRLFNVGDRVFLFNYRLKIFSGKLKTHWTGPFTVTQVFPYGTVELASTNGPNFKVNGHRLKHYFGGDIPPMVVPDL